MRFSAIQTRQSETEVTMKRPSKKRPLKPYGHLLVLLLGLFGTHTNIHAQDVVLDDIKAIVNDGVVLSSDLRSSLAFVKQQARSNGQNLPSDDALTKRVMQQLIDREIRRQHARNIGVAIDPSSVNRAVEQIARNNNMDTLQFRETLRNQGFNYDLFRDNIEQELLLQRLIERDVQARIRVSQIEIDDFVSSIKNDAASQQRYLLQHILIAAAQGSDATTLEEAQARANDVLAQLKAGADFASVAAAESDGARALKGGDLGWRTLQELPEFLASPVAALEVGDITEPIRSANGLHIVQLNDKQSGKQNEQAETLVRHIFIPGEDRSIQTQLNQLRQRIIGGESFASIAREVSQDPNSAPNGGELPWFTQGQMPPVMEATADALDKGQISEPFRTQFGWHLMELLDRRTRTVDDTALRQQAETALRQRKVEQETQRWQQQLRDDSFIELRG